MWEYIMIFVICIVLAVAIAVGQSVTKRNRKDHYDERQLLIRGNAYKAAFLTTEICSVVFIIALVVPDEPGLLDAYGVAMLCISLFAGVTVFAGYSIWNDAFLSTRQTPRSYMLLCIFIVLIESFNVSRQVASSGLKDLLDRDTVLYLCTAVSFAAILLILIIKQIRNRMESEA